MPTDHRAALAKIRRFDQLIAYLSPAQKIEAAIDRDSQVLVLFPVDLAIAFGDELGYAARAPQPQHRADSAEARHRLVAA